THLHPLSLHDALPISQPPICGTPQLFRGALADQNSGPETSHAEMAMQITGMLHGARLLQFVGFPATEVLGPAASEDEIKSLIDRSEEHTSELQSRSDL